MNPAPSDHLTPNNTVATVATLTALAADPGARVLAGGQHLPTDTSP